MLSFSGTWKMKSSEKFEDYLKELGINVMLRKMAAAAKPTVEIRQDGENFYIKTWTSIRSTEVNFKVGEEFEEETMDGRKMKSVVKWEKDDKLQCVQLPLKGDGLQTEWSREMVSENELILTMSCKDAVCTRVYVKE
ncbi:cellular retinoic acid-binding protein 2-like [Lethenteron reissneri]|uniref:cellular retinoic acid-binding protein 2-like n=1 Tax=Lethenteron reissneri TaxID=7753 RepID=UPI002AB78DDD|nr:cellular retinoic acid-binding protein 2-like [Lethenteron reissneri]